ncbi:MAG: hypothetical protein RMI91_13000 [Gemmatales bacterium]|nr:hypothetical protein [Gemmatales bacterium]MDW7995561.1 hypothetical protein [Gemmatales bacterium]
MNAGAGNTVGKSFLIWSCRQFEHGHGRVGYLASLFTAGKEQVNHIAIGLQETFGPRNGLWCAVTHTEKNYLAVVEQTTNHGYADRSQNIHAPVVNVDLVATRIASDSGQLIDTGCLAVSANVWRDLRPAYQKARGLQGMPGIKVAEHPEISERHPALASLGQGDALLVYSYRAGINKYKIHGVLLRE